MSNRGVVFNPPPGWPKPPAGWVPPKGWTPDPSWPPPPEGWQLWLPAAAEAIQGQSAPAASAPEGDFHVVTSGDSDARIALLEGELRALRLQLEALASEETVVFNDERVLQEVGIYRYHHPT